MPSSTPNPSNKFILDENVRAGLYKFLKAKGVNVKITAKGSSDQTLLDISRQEKRILVTNDQDFSECTKDEVYSVVWLRISQNDEEALLRSFAKLISEFKSFASKLIVLQAERWEATPLTEEFKR